MNCLRKAFIVSAIFWLCACTTISPGRTYHAQVISQESSNATANTYSSIQAAIDAAPDGAAEPYRIYIAAGDYYEKLTITKPHIQLVGAGKDKTRVYFDAYAGQEYTAGKTWGTRGSATIIVQAEDVQFHHLTIENSFDFLATDRLDKNDPKKISGTQAVALHLREGSDRVLVRDVKLLGYQDTLFVDAGRAWFDNTSIAGNVDFIFGAGNALFTDSDVITRKRGQQHYPHGYITAPSTQISSPYGLTFINCRLLRETGVPDNSTALGRPWHPTKDFPDGRYADPDAIGKSVFINTMMDAHITQDGWYSMGGTAREGGRKQFLPEDARFFEYQSYGEGVKVNPARRQLDEHQVKSYIRKNVLGDWNP